MSGDPAKNLTFITYRPKPKPDVQAIEVTEANIGTLAEHISAGQSPFAKFDGGPTVHWSTGDVAFTVGDVLLFNSEGGWFKSTNQYDLNAMYERVDEH
ncbi:hypothetical protein [Aeromicrobium sp. 179-A 4D2 NHS]|uniref:hypothetical protein n=1 Tax=Aeromicrobium sp. 179-A 4D2 NHS TaxID=3142375 RepID=UPI00399F6187